LSKTNPYKKPGVNARVLERLTAPDPVVPLAMLLLYDTNIRHRNHEIRIERRFYSEIAADISQHVTCNVKTYYWTTRATRSIL